MSWINTNNCMPLDNLTGGLTCPDSTAAPNGTWCDIEQVCYIGVSYLFFSYVILTLFSLKSSVNFIFIWLLSDYRNYEQIWNIRVHEYQLVFSLRRYNDCYNGVRWLCELSKAHTQHVLRYVNEWLMIKIISFSLRVKNNFGEFLVGVKQLGGVSSGRQTTVSESY